MPERSESGSSLSIDSLMELNGLNVTSLQVTDDPLGVIRIINQSATVSGGIIASMYDTVHFIDAYIS